MRILVVVPGEEFLAAAGVRIRYKRIAARLAELGHVLDLKLIDDVKPRPAPGCDVLLISKCYDARGLLLAAEMRQQGVQVGGDFFDDYYSQGTDSRFVHLRQWLRGITPSLTFTLCSTPQMRENLSTLVPGIPCHMMNDPYEEIDVARVAERVDHKLKRARASRSLDIGWFGIGGNPHFAVGLSDLEAFSGILADIGRHGYSPRLAILTNRSSLSPDRLQMLSRLPVPWRIEEWSEDAEKRLIERSYACFLPVNAQRFSVVKSLNRAVSALTGGAQVLSAGFPLYEAFGNFIYRDAASLAADIGPSKARLRRGTIPAFIETMDRFANPEREAAELSGFLGSLAPVAPTTAPAGAAILHGRTSVAAVHKYAQRNGYLSIAGFSAGSDLHYDVRPCLAPDTGEPSVQLSVHAMKLLRPELAALARQDTASPGKKFHLLPLRPGFAEILTRSRGGLPESEALALAGYQTGMTALPALADQLFDGLTVILSEPGSPYWCGPALARSAA